MGKVISLQQRIVHPTELIDTLESILSDVRAGTVGEVICIYEIEGEYQTVATSTTNLNAHAGMLARLQYITQQRIDRAV